MTQPLAPGRGLACALLALTLIPVVAVGCSPTQDRLAGPQMQATGAPVGGGKPDLTPSVWIAIAAGGAHTCGLRTGGVAYCWGYNDEGQLGIGTWSETDVPRLVKGDIQFTAISASLQNSCGVELGVQRAHCWGRNQFGQLGNGTWPNSQTVPVQVSGQSAFTRVAAGMWFVCGATGSSGECWGMNLWGQLGIGGGPASWVPAPVLWAPPFEEVAAGRGHACGVTGPGGLYCWGSNAFGQLGLGSTVDADEPMRVSESLLFEGVTAGDGHTCAWLPSGKAACWGGNDYGQLGLGSTLPSTKSVFLDPDPRFKTISAGAHHTCGLDDSGEAFCWGRNDSGQLGDGTVKERHVPTSVKGGLKFATISSGDVAHTCGVTISGAAYCWGMGAEGQLGTGNGMSSLVPVRVRTPTLGS